MVVILDLVKMISHHSSCGGLNEKCPLSLHYLNTCHPVGGAVWGRCSLLEEVCLSLGVGFESSRPHPTSSLLFLLPAGG